MKLDLQKRLACQVLKAGTKRVKFDIDKLPEIKAAITKSDIRALVRNGVISKIDKCGVSRSRARDQADQKRKGRRHGKGSLKGKASSRLPRKLKWINLVRSQRDYLKMLKGKDLLSVSNYRLLRNKVKGGAFRSVRHIRLFIDEYNLMKKKNGN
ncbi:MAG: 50S ribosomal protein L19e [Candidatus Nanoarchaeia archaeon]|nr:50S ribosomal protein L19e [Candidatus Nanoarchaeia archaeon]